MATFWERAAHSFDHNLCSLCILTISYFSYFPWWFEGTLITPVPGHCILVTIIAVLSEVMCSIERAFEVGNISFDDQSACSLARY